MRYIDAAKKAAKPIRWRYRNVNRRIHASAIGGTARKNVELLAWAYPAHKLCAWLARSATKHHASHQNLTYNPGLKVAGELLSLPVNLIE